ncbi:MAG: hypothetical protein A4E72_02197 [Syntrophus sp. PtaU1.Bin208]|nr:MAG: hypothetical protein A4E72_02197 [Syntrophus sp. PtaU1.Bin208]
MGEGIGTVRKKIKRIKKSIKRQFWESKPIALLTQVRRSRELALRRSREARPVALPSEGYSRLRFYQFKKDTVEFFFKHVGRPDIRVPDTPHYRLAQALAGGVSSEIEAGVAFYKAYLDAASRTTDSAPLEPSVEEFQKELKNISERPLKSPPVVVTQILPDGELFVVDGNSRIAAALALGREIPIELWPFDLAFMKFSPFKEFYGTRHNNRPYQSIYFQQQIAVPGRRQDTAERLSLIPGEVLSGAQVLDVASNFGMSSILARSFGAVSVLGLEISGSMVDLASRFSMLEGVYPDVQFRRFNIDRDFLGDEERFDTAFMFSIFAHLSNPAHLTRIAERNIRKYVVFEAHPGGTYEAYKSFFDSGLFSSVVELGRLSRSVLKLEERTRILWLCTKARFE